MSRLYTKSLTYKDLTGDLAFDDFGGISLGDGPEADEVANKSVTPKGIFVSENDFTMVVRDGKWHPIWELGHLICAGAWIEDTLNTPPAIGCGEIVSNHLLPNKRVESTIQGFAQYNQVLFGSLGNMNFSLPGVYLISMTLRYPTTATGNIGFHLKVGSDIIAEVQKPAYGGDVLHASNYYHNAAAAPTTYVDFDIVAGTSQPAYIVNFSWIRVSLLKA